MRHVLLIRPLEDAFPLAKVIESKGAVPHLYPLFKPRFFPFAPLRHVQALLITSKNAIRAIKDDETLKKITLYVVGDQTANFAKDMGFLNVLNASGTSQELEQLILQNATRKGGILWHLSGKRVKHNIVASLKAAGFEANRRIVYDIEEVEDLPPSLIEELETQKLSHILFFSPHTTTIFVNLLKKKGLEKTTCLITALCLSHDISKKLVNLQWKETWISPKPTIEDLVGYFDEER